MGSLIYKLLKAAENIELSEFGHLLIPICKEKVLSPEKKESIKNYIKREQEIREYTIEFLKQKIRVYHAPKNIFLGLYGIDPDKEIYSNETISGREGSIIVISILKEWTLHEKLENIFVKSLVVVRNLKKTFEITDSETGAYLFGWLVESIVRDVIGLQGIRQLLGPIESRQKVEFHLSKAPEKRCTIVSSSQYKGEYLQSLSSRAAVCYRYGQPSVTMLFPKRKNTPIFGDDINSWAHELYHMTENIRGMTRREEYLWDYQVMVEVMWSSLSILKYNVKEKLCH